MALRATDPAPVPTSRRTAGISPSRHRRQTWCRTIRIKASTRSFATGLVGDVEGTVQLTVFLARAAGRVQRERCRSGTNTGDVSAKKSTQSSAEAEATREFLRLASDRGLSLTGPDGLLKQFTKTVLETTSLRRQLVAATGSAYGAASGSRRECVASSR